MATYTSNLNLKKPALDDDALITDINNNMDILDAAANGIEDAMAIVANGNTHAAITSGQFVYVRNHSTLAEGLYVASSNIAANATLSSSNLTADSKGGLNALSEHIVYQAGDSISFTTACAFGRAFDSGSGCIFTIVLEKSIPAGKTVTITKNGSVFAYVQGQTVVVSALTVQNYENNMINAQATFATSVAAGSPIIIQPVNATISIS